MASAARAPLEHIERRRSERFAFRVALMVCGQSIERAVREETVALSINSHGALPALSADVALGQKVVLMNPQTGNETEARVSRLAALHDQWTADSCRVHGCPLPNSGRLGLRQSGFRHTDKAQPPAMQEIPYPD